MRHSWDSLFWAEQTAENLRAFAALHRMQVPPDWPEVRIEATIAADRRIRTFEQERVDRLEMYARGGATDAYRRRWHTRTGQVFDLHPERFTRGLR
jgi:hypothetical protein